MTRGGIWTRNVDLQQPIPVLSLLSSPVSEAPSVSISPSITPSISLTPTEGATTIQKRCESNTLNFWSDGDPRSPYCSYHRDNDCPITVTRGSESASDEDVVAFEFATDIIKSKCAIGVCQAAGFDTGDFLDTSKDNFCVEDSEDLQEGDNDWYYLVDNEEYSQAGAAFVDIVAVCCNFN